MIVIADCGGASIHPLEEITYEYSDFKRVPILDISPNDLSGIQGIIISDGTSSVTEDPMERYMEKVKLLCNQKVPVLGINFGHRLLGITHGSFGSVMRQDSGWQTVEIFEDCPLFGRLPSEISMMKSHRETVSIPPHFRLVASSDGCVNEAMQHESLLLFGVQFQPELSGNHGAVIIENFCRLCQPTNN